MPSIFFVTQNKYKFQQFQKVTAGSPITFKQLSLATPEIQAKSNREVVEFSAQWMANQCKKPVVVEDVGLYIKAYNGFPGPYLSQVENWLGSTGFLKLMHKIKDREAYWEYAISFCQPEKRPVSFVTHQTGIIAQKDFGKSGWQVDKIFIPTGETKTIAQLIDEQKYIRNNKHYQQLIEYLTKNLRLL